MAPRNTLGTKVINEPSFNNMLLGMPEWHWTTVFGIVEFILEAEVKNPPNGAFKNQLFFSICMLFLVHKQKLC